MTSRPRLLILEDEPFIMLDLEMAGLDRGCEVVCCGDCKTAFAKIETLGAPDVAVLDVSLEGDETCMPIARELKRRGIPFVLHTGDLVQPDGTVCGIDAPVITKPASALDVIDTALGLPNPQDDKRCANG